MTKHQLASKKESSIECGGVDIESVEEESVEEDGEKKSGEEEEEEEEEEEAEKVVARKKEEEEGREVSISSSTTRTTRRVSFSSKTGMGNFEEDEEDEPSFDATKSTELESAADSAELEAAVKVLTEFAKTSNMMVIQSEHNSYLCHE